MFCIVKRGELLGEEKLVHIPGIPIGMTKLSEKDEEIVRTGIRLNVDVIIVPGVRNAEFFRQVKRFVCKSLNVIKNEGLVLRIFFFFIEN